MKLLLVALAFFALNGAPKKDLVNVVIQTSKGDIFVELDRAHAPETTKNFLRYVDGGRYISARFHRAVTMENQPDKNVKIEVIQGGVHTELANKDYAPIKLERTSVTGLRHLNGTI